MIAVALDILTSENAPEGSVAYWRAVALYFEHLARHHVSCDEKHAAAIQCVKARLKAGKAHVAAQRRGE